MEYHFLTTCCSPSKRFIGYEHGSFIRNTKMVGSVSDHSILFVDLPTHLSGISTIPTDILVTNLRPDLVILDRIGKSITLFELSVPFETNISASHLRKIERYEKLIQDLQNVGFKVSYYAFEIGSRGFISKDNASRLKSIFHQFSTSKNVAEVKRNIMKISLLCSFIIYHSKFDEHWVRPAYVAF